MAGDISSHKLINEISHMFHSALTINLTKIARR